MVKNCKFRMAYIAFDSEAETDCFPSRPPQVDQIGNYFVSFLIFERTLIKDILF